VAGRISRRWAPPQARGRPTGRREGPSSGSRLPSLGRDLPGRTTFDRLAPLVAVGVGVGPKHRALPAVSFLDSDEQNPFPAEERIARKRRFKVGFRHPWPVAVAMGKPLLGGARRPVPRLGRALQRVKQSMAVAVASLARPETEAAFVTRRSSRPAAWLRGATRTQRRSAGRSHGPCFAGRRRCQRRSEPCAVGRSSAPG